MTDDQQNMVPVCCGHVSGFLHLELFRCPGIHSECIETDGQMVTPKHFSVLGAKERLKDWKNAIRMNGKSLRRLIDLGELDFYKHDESCTGRCYSRSIPKTEKDNLMSVGKFEDFAPPPPKIPRASKPTKQRQRSRKIRTKPAFEFETLGAAVLDEPPVLDGPMLDDEVAPITVEPLKIKMNPGTSILRPSFTIKQEPADEFTTEMERKSKGLPLGKLTPLPGSSVDIQQLITTSEGIQALDIVEDSYQFWNCVADFDLMGNFFKEIVHSLHSYKFRLIHGIAKPVESRVMSNIVHELGLTKKLKSTLVSVRSQTEMQKSKLLAEIEELKRKVAETEMREQELNRRSHTFNQLVDRSAKRKQLCSRKRFSPLQAKIDALNKKNDPALITTLPLTNSEQRNGDEDDEVTFNTDHEAADTNGRSDSEVDENPDLRLHFPALQRAVERDELLSDAPVVDAEGILDTLPNSDSSTDGTCDSRPSVDVKERQSGSKRRKSRDTTRARTSLEDSDSKPRSSNVNNESNTTETL